MPLNAPGSGGKKKKNVGGQEFPSGRKRGRRPSLASLVSPSEEWEVSKIMFEIFGLAQRVGGELPKVPSMADIKGFQTSWLQEPRELAGKLRWVARSMEMAKDEPAAAHALAFGLAQIIGAAHLLVKRGKMKNAFRRLGVLPINYSPADAGGPKWLRAHKLFRELGCADGMPALEYADSTHRALALLALQTLLNGVRLWQTPLELFGGRSLRSGAILHEEWVLPNCRSSSIDAARSAPDRRLQRALRRPETWHVTFQFRDPNSLPTFIFPRWFAEVRDREWPYSPVMVQGYREAARDALDDYFYELSSTTKGMEELRSMLGPLEEGDSFAERIEALRKRTLDAFDNLRGLSLLQVPPLQGLATSDSKKAPIRSRTA